MKICSKCGIAKPLPEFHRSIARKDGYVERCKDCKAAYQHQYYQEHRTRIRAAYKVWHHSDPSNKRRKLESHLFKAYGITLQQYETILAAQNGVCAICQQSNTSLDRRTHQPLRLNVDHDHETGQIRGLLCHKCNVMLGLLGDDAQVMERAIVYLDRAIKQRKIIQLELFNAS